MFDPLQACGDQRQRVQRVTWEVLVTFDTGFVWAALERSVSPPCGHAEDVGVTRISGRLHECRMMPFISGRPLWRHVTTPQQPIASPFQRQRRRCCLTDGLSRLRAVTSRDTGSSSFHSDSLSLEPLTGLNTAHLVKCLQTFNRFISLVGGTEKPKAAAQHTKEVTTKMTPLMFKDAFWVSLFSWFPCFAVRHKLKVRRCQMGFEAELTRKRNL